MLGRFANHVHDVVDRDPAEQATVVVDDRCGDQVAVFEFHHDLAGVRVDRDRFQRGIHHVADNRVGFLGQQHRQLEAAQVTVVAVHHEQHVKHLGQFFAHAQVAQDHVQGHVGADGQEVRIHEAAGGVLRVGQDLGQAGTVLLRHRAEDLAGDLVRQVVQDVREVVEFEVSDRLDQLFRRTAANQGATDLIVDVDQDLAVQVGVGHFPDGQALGYGQGLQQVADLGSRQVAQQLPDLELRAGIQCLGYAFEVACRFFLLYLFRHDPSPWLVRSRIIQGCRVRAANTAAGIARFSRVTRSLSDRCFRCRGCQE